MDDHLRMLARTQLDLVARWQLIAAGYSADAVDARAWRGRWRIVNDGVYALNQAPLTRQQRWLAGCLTAPGTLLAGPSAGACWGFLARDPSAVFLVRFGTGGPRQYGGLYVRRSTVLAAEVHWLGPIPLTSAERTLIDLAPHLRHRELARATREAIRLKRTTAQVLLDALDRHRGWRGTRRLRELATMYAQLPIERTRSDAEGMALERIFRGGGVIPASNEMVGGVEADLVDHDRKLIVEIDGPQFHLFPEEDARKEAAWQAKGYSVVRLPSDAVYR